MKFGPFSRDDLRRIEPILTKCGINYDIVAEDEQAKGKGLFLELNDAEIQQYEKFLAPFGISAPVSEEPSFEEEDYVCPKCHHVAEAPGSCPNDGTPLNLYSEYATINRTKSQKTQKVVTMILFGIPALLFLFQKIQAWLTNR